MLQFKVLPLWETGEYMYPRMYSLHDMADYVCKKDEKNRLPMPPIVQLSSERMTRGGVYFINTGQEMFMWVSRSVPVQFCIDAFGLSHYDAIPDDLVSDRSPVCCHVYARGSRQDVQPPHPSCRLADEHSEARQRA
jgi:hypothetical protein